MGVSFTISKKGKRYTPKPKVEETSIEQDQDFDHGDDVRAPQTQAKNQNQNLDQTQGVPAILGDSFHHSAALGKSELEEFPDHEVSFWVNLFPEGFLVTEVDEFFDDVPETLLPYNSQTSSFLSAIEYGCLPGDLSEDIPCKYVNGAVLCEIRDYRDAIESPVSKKVSLKMGLENIVKDIASMSDSLSYMDSLKLESIMVQLLHPHLNLDPKPIPGIFKENVPTKKVDLRIDWGRKTRNIDDESNQNLVGSQAGNSDFPSEGQAITDHQRDPTGTDMSNFCEAQSCRHTPTMVADIETIEKSQEQELDSGQQQHLVNQAGKRTCGPTEVLEGIPDGVKQELAACGELSSLDAANSKRRRKNSNQKSNAPPTSQIPVSTQRKRGPTSKGPTSKKNNVAKSNVNAASLPLSIAAMNVVESLTRLDEHSMEMPVPSQPAVVSDPVLDRFLKIDTLTKRHGLNSRKPQECLMFRTSIDTTPLVGSLLEEAKVDERKQGVIKTRTVTFVCSSCAYQENQRANNPLMGSIPITDAVSLAFMGCEKCRSERVQHKLVIMEKLGKEMVEVVYGSGGIQRPCHTFVHMQQAEVFARQFTSSMFKEGYIVDTDVHQEYQLVGGRFMPVPNQLRTANDMAILAAFEHWPATTTSQASSDPFPALTELLGSTSCPNTNIPANFDPQPINSSSYTQLLMNQGKQQGLETDIGVERQETGRGQLGDGQSQLDLEDIGASSPNIASLSHSFPQLNASLCDELVSSLLARSWVAEGQGGATAASEL